MDNHYPLLDTEIDTTLEQPDLEKLRDERLERNRQFLTSMNASIAARVLPKVPCEMSPCEAAAICIQRWVRGYLGRKIYVEKLYQRFVEEEERQNERVRYQMEEGELLVETRQLEVLFDDDRTTRRNAKRLLRSKIVTIQRAWRAYLKKVKKSQTLEESQQPNRHSNRNHSNSNLETISYEQRSTALVRKSDDCEINEAPRGYVESVEPKENIRNIDFEVKGTLVSHDQSKSPSGTSVFETQDEYVYNNPLISSEVNEHTVTVQTDDILKSATSLPPYHAAASKLPDDSELVRLPRESEEDFYRRQRKTTLLKRAQRFFEVNKFDVKDLPVDLGHPTNVTHVPKIEPTMHAIGESSDVETRLKQTHDENSNNMEFCLQGEKTHENVIDFQSDVQVLKGDKNTSDNFLSKESNRSAACDTNVTTHGDSESDINIHSNSKICESNKPNSTQDNSISQDSQGDKCMSQLQTTEKDCENVAQLTKGDNVACLGKEDSAKSITKGDNTHTLQYGDTCSSKSAENSDVGNLNSSDKGGNATSTDKGDTSNTTEDELCAFDVYNIETAMPDINWASLEEKLALAQVEEEERQKARRNDREEIRKKLAMGVDDDYYDDENDDDDDAGDVYKKPTLHSRLQGGMNLQICFMNDSPGDADTEGRSPRQYVDPDNVAATAMAKGAGIVDSDNNLQSMPDMNPMKLLPDNLEECGINSKLKATAASKDINFQSKQELLQNEAKLALAQAGSMARMQLEIEKQLQKKSPMAEMVGIPGLGERRRKKLGMRKLQEMNLAQIQVLYNDLQTQIESLNEDLVKLLMERDELHMEQDSMLVDVEDLTRRAEELAEKANSTPAKKAGKSQKSNGSLKGRILGR